MGKLRSLEINNFKSYSGQHVIGPFNDFTCVIGPNGAGKSNLMDAISFVLGVKSSHLRSSQLKDLIHRQATCSSDSLNIKKSVKPENGGASVLAIYQKTDGVVIEFKRSITPAGVSEYYINNCTVAFAQYTMALEAENILVKARNFLVFQGDVEMIASQNSRGLTRMIEQISGSDEFKQEYERLELELSKMAENSALSFNKKRSLSAEIKQFKEQKDEAIRFGKLLEEKQNLTTTFFLWRLFHIENILEQLNTNVKRKQDAVNVLITANTVAEVELKKKQQEYAVSQKQKVIAEKDIENLKKDAHRAQSQVSKLDEKTEHVERKLKMHHDSLEKLKLDFSKGEHEISDLQAQLFALDLACKEFKANSSNSSNASINLTPDQLNAYQELRKKFNSKMLKELQQLKALKRKFQSETEALSRFDDDITLLSGKKERLSNAGKSYLERKQMLSIALEKAKNDIKSFEYSLSKAIEDKKCLRRNEAEVEERLSDVYKTLNQAKFDRKETDRADRLRNSVDALKRMFSGVHGRVIDLCTPVQKKFETAISVVLGKNLDAVIVDNDKIAIECIKYLKDQRIGQAVFIPIDNIEVKPIDEKYRLFSKGCRLAIDLIQFASKFERAFIFACGNTLVCDDLAAAREVCFEKNQKVKAVTLDGTIIHKAGMITGGRSADISNNAGKWEEKDLDQLRCLKDRLESQIDELARSKRALADEQLLRDKIAALESQIVSNEEDLSVISRKLQSIEEEYAHNVSLISIEVKKKSKAQNDISVIQNEMKDMIDLLNQKEDDIFRDFCAQAGFHDIREYESNQKSHQIVEKCIQFTKQRALLESELLFAYDRLTKVREKMDNLQSIAEKDDSMLLGLGTEREKLAAQVDSIRSDLSNSSSLLEALSSETARKRNDMIVIQQEYQIGVHNSESLTKELMGMESLIEKLYAERYEIFRRAKMDNILLPMKTGSIDDIQLGNLQSTAGSDAKSSSSFFDINSDNAKIKVEFDELDDDLKQNSDEVVENVFNERIASISGEIDRMMPNMKAIEKLQDVENRLKETAREFEESRLKAKSARENFLAIKRKRMERFSRAFNHITENIDRIYKELTKNKVHPVGGTAYLTLENSEEPYNSGIKYHAMPPMKRFRDMELLSGGEKTMAALALLFAIHSYQPSPFFVMDEVDAALDNANIVKIAEFIQKNASDSFQFIVISLKSTFYEKSQALIGIYKDWNAVSSRILTVDLTNYQE